MLIMLCHGEHSKFMSRVVECGMGWSDSVAWQDPTSLADTWVYEGTGVPLLATPCQGLAGAEGISAMRRPKSVVVRFTFSILQKQQALKR